MLIDNQRDWYNYLSFANTTVRDDESVMMLQVIVALFQISTIITIRSCDCYWKTYAIIYSLSLDFADIHIRFVSLFFNGSFLQCSCSFTTSILYHKWNSHYFLEYCRINNFFFSKLLIRHENKESRKTFHSIDSCFIKPFHVYINEHSI